MRSQFTSYEQLPITLTADHVADGRTQRPFPSVDHGQRKWLI